MRVEIGSEQIASRAWIMTYVEPDARNIKQLLRGWENGLDNFFPILTFIIIGILGIFIYLFI
jgi:hypothetical protein